MYVDLGLYIEGQAAGGTQNPWGYQYSFDAMANAPQYHINIRISGDEAGYASLSKCTTGGALQVILENTSELKELVVKGNREIGIEGYVPLSKLGLNVDSKIQPIVVISGNNEAEHGAFNVIPEDIGNSLQKTWDDWRGDNKDAPKNLMTKYANTYVIQESTTTPVEYTSPEVSGNRVTFRYLAPDAYSVRVKGEFNDWEPTQGIMTKNTDGVWEGQFTLKQLNTGYGFEVIPSEGATAQWSTDPKNNNKKGSNSAVYMEGLEFTQTLEVKIGSSISLPKVKYYKQTQQVEEVQPQYTLLTSDSKLTLSIDGQLTVAADYPAGKIQLQAAYNGLTTIIEVNAVTELIKSPVINPDGTVTFNIPSYTGEKLYIAGTVEGEDWNGKEITKNEKGMFSYTTKNPVAPGKYQYKFKLSNTNWDGSFIDPLNPGTEDNSILIVPGLVVKAMSVQKGVATALPTSATLWNNQGESAEVTPNYVLKAPVPAGVTLENGILTVDKTFTGNSVDLIASSGNQELVIKVEVVSQLYTYKINYYRPIADYTEWSIWTWETGKDGVDVSFATDLLGEFKQAIHKVPSNTLNFKFKKGDWKGEDGGNRIITVPAGQTEVEVWCVQGDEKVYYSKPDLTAKVQSALADSKDMILVSFNNPITALTGIELKDVAADQVIATTARKTETGWSLTGKKSIVSNCRYTDILLILAKVQEANGEDGYGFFIVDTTRPGVAFGDDIAKPGLQGLPVNSVTFDQVILPEDSLLGLTLNGESQLNDIIKKLQLGLSAISIGISEGAFETGLAFVKVKRRFGKPLIDATVYQHQFADLYTKLCAAESYFASYKDRMKEDSLFVSQIKLYTTKVAIEISEEIIRLIGPLQTLDDIPIDRYLKDAKTIEIYGKSGDSIRKRIAAQWIKE